LLHSSFFFGHCPTVGVYITIECRYVVEWRSGIELATDGQLASTSWCQAALWGPWPDFTCSLVWLILSPSCRVPPLTGGWVCILQCTSLTDQSCEGPITIYYCIIWDFVLFSSPLKTRKVTVEVFYVVKYRKLNQHTVCIVKYPYYRLALWLIEVVTNKSHTF
jgi:hypothetical protein